ncbi:MAG: sigma-70 family RNA polymerase sigma factor [Acidobacteria bacterium]|nr:sigma-70 family RNA polymerase sigma factor [Acidobacteriota bacterium]
MGSAHDTTDILRSWQAGDADAPERLFPLVYDELKRRASHFLSRERRDHTLQPTALVHEAYLRMIDQTLPTVENRLHFYSLASRIMRQVLVDHARRHNAEKRGGAASRLSSESIEVCSDTSLGDVLQLHEAIEQLSDLDRRKAQVVEMRYFGGLSDQEIAGILNVSEKTVQRDWQFAKAWLYKELSHT